MGEATYNETHVEVETLNNSIAMAELELTKLANEQKAIFEELHEMKRGEGSHFSINLLYTLTNLRVMHQT